MQIFNQPQSENRMKYNYHRIKSVEINMDTWRKFTQNIKSNDKNWNVINQMVCSCDGYKSVEMELSNMKGKNVCLKFIFSTSGDNRNSDDNGETIAQEQEYELVDVEDDKYYRGNHFLLLE